ncbi:MAG: hypothetical protein ABI267_02350, partial [Ginsengibacter sp.]
VITRMELLSWPSATPNQLKYWKILSNSRLFLTWRNQLLLRALRFEDNIVPNYRMQLLLPRHMI